MGIIYSKEITAATNNITTTTSTTTSKLNVNSDPGPVIQMVGQGQ